MGGWLILTQPGLAPDKKHQAALGALTFEISYNRTKRVNLAVGLFVSPGAVRTSFRLTARKI